MYKFQQIIDFIKQKYKGKDIIPLHEPYFNHIEEQYLLDCIRSGYVSSIGSYVEKFEKLVADFCGAKFAIATVNGTSALHIALLVAEVKPGDEVITQPLTFVATANAIKYTGANPVFIDVDLQTTGMSPESLSKFLKENAIVKDNQTFNRRTNAKIAACVPMHTFGHPCRIDEIAEICKAWNITLIEDAAESIGSFYKKRHTGTFGEAGILSFNGNKIITTGGGGIILTNNPSFAEKAKHLSTTGKVPHKWEYFHDCLAYNYRLPNINAALGCAQMEHLNEFLEKKRLLARDYQKFFKSINVKFITESEGAKSNYWLNTIMFESKLERDNFLEFSHSQGVQCRPPWQLLNKLPMYKNCFSMECKVAEYVQEHAVNIPSSIPK